MKTVDSIRNSHTEAHSMRRPKIMFSVSMAIFGTLGLFTRNISLSSGELALYSAILAAALILVYLALTKQKIDLKSLRRDIPLLLASGAAMGINWILLFQAYRYTTISAATLSYYFAPVIVTVASPFLFREKLTAKQILCFCMSTLGLVMIIGIGNLKQGGSNLTCFLQVLFPQKCRLNSSKLHGEFPQYCISSSGTLSGARGEPLQAYKVY